MSTRTADDGAPRRAPQARLAVQLLIGAVLLLVVWRLRDVALISFGAIIAAALLRGLAAPLARHTRLSSRLAIVVVIVALATVLLAALWLTGQPMLQQLQELRNTVPRAWETALRWLQAQPFGPQLLTWLDSAGDLKVPWERVAGFASAATTALADVFLVLLLASTWRSIRGSTGTAFFGSCRPIAAPRSAPRSPPAAMRCGAGCSARG